MNADTTITARICAIAAIAVICFTAACGSDQGKATDAPTQDPAAQPITADPSTTMSADAAERRARAAEAHNRASGSWGTPASPDSHYRHP